MSLLERVDVVLVHPEQPGNVGMVARVLANLGIDSLVLVEPRFRHWAEARKLAVHAVDLLERARRAGSLAEAVGADAWVVATSCRGRRHAERKPPLGPEEFLERAGNLAAPQRLALVFGPESTGLSNRLLGQCQDILRLPTSGHYPSLNLAQAVALCAWELRRASLKPTAGGSARRRVSAGEVGSLVEHMRRTLANIDYLDPQNPQLVLDDLRVLIMRAAPNPRELAMLRGIFHKMDVWMSRHGGPANPNRLRRE